MHLTLWTSKMHKPILNLPEKSNKLVRSWGHPRFWGFIWFYDNWGWPQRLKPSGGEYLSMVRSTQPISSLYRKGGAHCLDSSVVLWASRFFKIGLLCIRALPVSCHSMWKLHDFQKLVQSSCPRVGHFIPLHTLAVTDTYLKWSFAISHPFTMWTNDVPFWEALKRGKAERETPITWISTSKSTAAAEANFTPGTSCHHKIFR